MSDCALVTVSHVGAPFAAGRGGAHRVRRAGQRRAFGIPAACGAAPGFRCSRCVRGSAGLSVFPLHVARSSTQQANIDVHGAERVRFDDTIAAAIADAVGCGIPCRVRDTVPCGIPGLVGPCCALHVASICCALHVALILRFVCGIDMPRVACCIDILRVAESFLNTVLEIGGARKSMARSPLSVALSRLSVPLIGIVRTLTEIIRSPYCDYPYPHRDHPYPSSRFSVPLIAIIRTLTAIIRTPHRDYPYPLSRLSVPLLR